MSNELSTKRFPFRTSNLTLLDLGHKIAKERIKLHSVVSRGEVRGQCAKE